MPNSLFIFLFYDIPICLSLSLCCYFICMYIIKGKDYSKYGKENSLNDFVNENDDYSDENDYYNTEYTEANYDGNMPYIRRTFLLTKRERALYRILKEQTANTKLNIHCKTRLEDLIVVAKNNQNKFADRNRIKSRHVDFAITDDESRILFCIELDDNTHDWETTKEKDLFKDKIFSETNIPLFRIKVGDDYQSEVEKILDFFI